MKLLTHVYLANLIIDEIEKTGELNIPEVKGNYSSGSLREPFAPNTEPGSKSEKELWESAGFKEEKPLFFPLKGGSHTVPDEVKRSILNNKTFFRGGAAACGLLPDIIFSRYIIHPSDSGIWIDYLFERFRMLSPGKERDEVYAFILGCMTHYATDLFITAYINEYAKGAYDPKAKDGGKKHVLIADYIDAAISDKISDQERTISVPSRFIASCFADSAGIEDQIKKVEKRSKDRAKEKITAYNGQELLPLRNRSFKYPVAEKEVRCIQSEPLYPQDVEEKTGEMEKWVSSWAAVAQKLLKGEGASTAIPSVIKELEAASPYRRLAEGMYGPKRSIGSIEVDIEGTILELRPKDKLKNDLKKFGKEKDYPFGKEGEFKAFSLCLAASKFCLMGNKELNKYLGKETFKQDEGKHFLRRVHLVVTEDKHLIDTFPDGRTLCGIEISTKSRTVAFSVMLSAEFARTGETLIEITAPVPVDEIKKITLFNASNFEWNFKGLEIEDEESGTTIARGTVSAKVVSGKDFPVEVDETVLKEIATARGTAQTIDVPAGIISWLYSLDGRDEPKDEPKDKSKDTSKDGSEDESKDEKKKKKQWESKNFAIYKALTDKKDFKPGLKADILSEDYGETKDKSKTSKEKEGTEGKTEEPAEITKTPEGDMMDVAFEGKYVPLKKRVFSGQKNPAPDSKKEGGQSQKKTKESGSQDETSGTEDKEEKPTSKKKDKADMDKTMDKEEPGPKSKKKDKTDTNKTMDKEEPGPKSKKKDKTDMDKTMEKEGAEEEQPKKKKDPGEISEKKDGGGMKDTLDKGGLEVSFKKKDTKEMDVAMDKDEQETQPKKKDAENSSKERNGADMDKSMDDKGYSANGTEKKKKIMRWTVQKGKDPMGDG
ncbi:hypothetical protein Mpt1_c01470 [Candidatus Methanoplasma termitum]|uniref:Phospholipase C/D domain-containing protein n=1 Tax=Candidatus Methanoplasma termitum TaxID=1577791 RepID=A0A0A7LA89_9ARCH|nr:hypothetical protein [Candidatus Methanoplasma termitum]AIZ56050.1 hypothetical protein Mpt1_c01470 [Candidatus Methanoplasma termitum]